MNDSGIILFIPVEMFVISTFSQLIKFLQKDFLQSTFLNSNNNDKKGKIIRKFKNFRKVLTKSNAFYIIKST